MFLVKEQSFEIKNTCTLLQRKEKEMMLILNSNHMKWFSKSGNQAH